MLEFMRKNAGSKLVWLIIGAISLVFVFFGVGGGLGGGGRLISVNGEEISLRDYENMTRALSRSTPDDPGADPVARDRAIRANVLTSLVSRALAFQFGRNLGMEPSGRAVARYIYGIEAFQVDGKFNKEQYEYQLGGPQRALEFERDAHRDLTVSRANALVGSLSQVYQPEALGIYHFRSDKMRFDYIFFPAEKFKANLAANDGVLEKFYASHGEGWRRPATLRVEYVEIKPADFMDKVEISDDDLKNAYAESGERFVKPESAQTSHILFRFPRMSPTDEEKAATLERAEAAAKGLTPENFAERAKELSDDPLSAENGGALGGINANTPLFNITEEVMALPLSTVSGPLESLVGYHLALVTGREEARPQTLDEVRLTLENELRTYRAREMAVARLEDLIVRTETNPNLADAAKSMNLTSQISEPFTAENPAEFFEGNQAAVQKAFQAEIGRVAAPVEEAGVLALFTPIERVDSVIPPLAEVRGEVETAWRADEASGLARREAAAFLKSATAGAWAAPEGASAGQSEFLPRLELMGSMPLIFADRMGLFAAINSVAAAGQISPVPVLGSLDGAEGCYVLKLADFQAASEEGFEGMESANIMVTESMNRAAVMTQVWMDELVKLAGPNIYVPEEFTN